MNKGFIYILVIILCSCGSSGNEMEGVYTRYSSGEFSKAYDTLVIFPVELSQNSCFIQRKTGYIRIINGTEQPKQFRSENMFTEFDPASRSLTDPKTGRKFLFRRKELVFGTAVYKKQ